MPQRFAIGDAVQTSLGKGVVRALRNNGRLLVDIAGRPVVISEAEISAPETRKQKTSAASTGAAAPPATVAPRSRSLRAEASVDLHGLTVHEALGRAEQALN